MRRVPWGAPLALALLLLVPAVAAAASRLGAMEGHLSIGYVKLFADSLDAPGGSISLSAGVDYPVVRTLRAGVDLGYDLLGSSTYQEGSLFATVDYSAFQVIGLLHWLPERLGPLRRVSLGPMLCNAHGDLTTAAGGAAFADRAVHQTSGGAAVQATLLPASASPVKLGLELGLRRAFLAGPDWTLLSVRLSVHY